jgi:hypothetical protein
MYASNDKQVYEDMIDILQVPQEARPLLAALSKRTAASKLPVTQFRQVCPVTDLALRRARAVKAL